MMKIKTLAKRISREVELTEDGEKNILFRRFEAPENLDELRASTRMEVCRFYEEINKAVPDDFDFTIILGSTGFQAQLEYADGLQTHAGMGFPVPNDEQFLDHLLKVDWDEMRGQFLPMTNMFDQLTDAVAEAPVNFKSTDKAQKDHFEAFTTFLSEAKQKNTKFAILAFDDSVNEIVYKECEGISQVRFSLGDYMALSLQIISLIVEGKSLTSLEIEAMKLEEAKTLGPISRAIAEGRMDGILAPN